MKQVFGRYWLIGLMVLCASAASGRDIQSELPVLRLQFEALSSDTFSAAVLTVPNGTDTMVFSAFVRHRGNTNLKYQKQSYAVKIVNEQGQKTDTSLLGMRSDNYWILDAMASDKARMRNRVAFDLWLDFSAKPYYQPLEPKMVNGCNGRFVELYVNDDYRGIYCLMERVDRKQLKLKKVTDGIVRGVLYKAINYYLGFFTTKLPVYNNLDLTWGRFEFKYPEPEDGPTTWEPLYNDMLFAIESETEEYATEAPNRYDLPVFIDYYLFTALMSARDNMGKNFYLSYYNILSDSKMLITPWDMDHSWGRTFTGAEEDAAYPVSVWGHTLYERMKKENPSYSAVVNNRYAQLREGAFSNDSLKARFAAYFDLFRSTGADIREEERWSGIDNIDLNFEQEETYIKNWIDRRLAYCDSLFDYSPSLPTDIRQTANDTLICRKRLMDGGLYFERNHVLHDVTGKRVR